MTASPLRASVPSAGMDPPGSGSSTPSGWTVVGILVLSLTVAVGAIAIPVAIVRSRNDRVAEAQDRSGRATTFDPPLTDEERELLTRVPFAIRVEDARVVWAQGVRCARVDTAKPAVASFACDLRDAGAERVRYTAFASAVAMERAYERLRRSSGIERYAGACADGPPAEGNWQVTPTGRVVPDGRILCLERNDVGTIVWTRNDLAVLTEAWSAGDWGALHRFWSLEAGPVG